MADTGNLLRDVQMAEFALTEVGLFLDTHPTDENALAYHRRYRELHDRAVEAYTAARGPLTVLQPAGERWKWVDGPFPWERAANA